MKLLTVLALILLALAGRDIATNYPPMDKENK